MTTRISVIIPVFRGRSMAEAAILSALGQTIPCNVVVVDDASGDGTAEALHDLAARHPRLTVLEQSVNQGPAAARNRAIEAAVTEWVALLDADDRLAPDRLEKMLALADGHGWDFIADDLWRVTDWNDLDGRRRHWTDTAFGAMDLTLERFLLENLFAICGQGRELGYIKPLMRRETLCRLNLSYNREMRLAEDFDLYARALIAGVRFGLVDPQGYYAFDRPGSLSKMHNVRDLEAAWRSARRIWQSGGLTQGERSAAFENMVLAHKKWAWVRLIEAKRSGNPLEAVRSFIAPPAVVGELVSRMKDHFSGGEEAEPKPRRSA